MTNTALDFAIYATLTRGWTFWRAHYLLANTLTFTIVVTWSFFWNKRWAFENRERRYGAQYTRFVTVNIGGIGIAQSALYLGVRFFGNDLLVKALIAPIIVAWNFLMYRSWTFRPTRVSAA